MVWWTVHPPSGNGSFLSLALTGLRLQALDLLLSLLPFCLSISIYSRLRRSLRRFLPCLCRVVENWEIVGVTRIERKRREGPPLVDAWTPRGSAHVASVPKLHD